jgi:hypothetical protein
VGKGVIGLRTVELGMGGLERLELSAFSVPSLRSGQALSVLSVHSQIGALDLLTQAGDLLGR